MVSGVYNITISGVDYPSYCYITNSKAYTMLLKMDGAATTFAYDSALWTNNSPYNPTAYSTALAMTSEYKVRLKSNPYLFE